MAVERKFISEGVRRVRVEKYLTKELKRAGFGGMDIARTPLGTQVTIFAEKPGIVIGKGGKVIRQLTQDLATNYGVDTPQVDVQQVPNPNFNAQIMAERLASAIERGWYFRKAGSSILRRVMDCRGPGLRGHHRREARPGRGPGSRSSWKGISSTPGNRAGPWSSGAMPSP